MIEIQPSAKLEWCTPDPMLVIERAGRTAYQSEDVITETSHLEFIRRLIRAGHESVIEHASASIRFVTDRGVSHELVRHRLSSFTQASTRFCRYDAAKFGGQIRVIPPSLPDEERRSAWQGAILAAEAAYMELLMRGVSTDLARSVLPTCLATEIVVTANFREWRHIFRLRLSARAHPQMRQIMGMAFDILAPLAPPVFADLVQDC